MLAESLLRSPTAQGLLYVAYGFPSMFSRVPVRVPPTFFAATIARYDTSRTNRCLALQSLPSPEPTWKDILLFSGDAAKAELFFGGERGSRSIAEHFFDGF